MPAEYHCLVKLGHQVYNVPREIADELEEEGLVELIDDGTAISGFFVPRRGVKPAAIRKRLPQEDQT